MPIVKINGLPVFLEIKGNGESLLLLHAAGSSGVQWTAAKRRLENQYRLIIPDLLGEGRTPGIDDWSDTIEKETQLIESLLNSTGGPSHIVGHSYGGVLAMKIALRNPHLVKSLTLIEPVAFNLLGPYPMDKSLQRLYNVKDLCRKALEAGDNINAARSFISYWAGNGIWDLLGSTVQQIMANSAKKLVSVWDDLFNDKSRMEDFNGILAPTLVISGDQGPAPIRWVAAQLAETIKGARFLQISGAGHMSPITNSREVNDGIQFHLKRIDYLGKTPDKNPEKLWKTEKRLDNASGISPDQTFWQEKSLKP